MPQGRKNKEKKDLYGSLPFGSYDPDEEGGVRADPEDLGDISSVGFGGEDSPMFGFISLSDGDSAGQPPVPEEPSEFGPLPEAPGASLTGSEQGDQRQLIRICGEVSRIIYRNDENGYTVMEIIPDGGSAAAAGDEVITATGILPYAAEGQTLRAQGAWETHSRYGRQFKIESCEADMPRDAEEMYKYLASRAIKGIGPRTARRIVDRFASDTFDVIENHPEWLTDIQGISRQKAEQISESFNAQFGVRTMVMFCGDIIGPAAAVRAYNRLGGGAVDMVKKNPYLLARPDLDIGFEKADQLAAALDIPRDDPERVKAGLKYILRFNASANGNVCLPRAKLTEAACQLLSLPEGSVSAALDAGLADGELIALISGGETYIYLFSYYEAEKYIARKLNTLNSIRVNDQYDGTAVERIILSAEMDFGIEYAPLQRQAVVGAVDHGVMILTGGPGTGKTTVIRGLLRVFDRMGFKCALAAPTGRAAKRMSEATSCEAKTVHRLLEVTYAEDSDTMVFARNQDNHLEEDVIIIDEASMLDTMLMSSLLQAIKPGARLILVGDADQLPSVGAGNVLCDMIESGAFTVVALNEIFRQAGQSMIVVNAHRINNGEEPYLNSEGTDFFFISREEEDIPSTISDLISRRLPAKYGEEAVSGIQVITPSRRHPCGAVELNRTLQQVMNPPRKGLAEHVTAGMAGTWRIGDKVMQIKNDYNLEWERGPEHGTGIFNGDVGRIVGLDEKLKEMTVDFGGADQFYGFEMLVRYDFTQLNELDHAYAITVHKSQGSEYKTVIIPLYRYTPKLLTRNLLYTAVTRAKKMVILVGRRDVLSEMIRNSRHIMRYTGLKEQIRSGERADAAPALKTNAGDS